MYSDAKNGKSALEIENNKNDIVGKEFEIQNNKLMEQYKYKHVRMSIEEDVTNRNNIINNCQLLGLLVHYTMVNLGISFGIKIKVIKEIKVLQDIIQYILTKLLRNNENISHVPREDYFVSNVSKYIKDNFSPLCVFNAHIYNAEAYIPTCNANREIIAKYISIRNYSGANNDPLTRTEIELLQKRINRRNK